jgi:hypothetical protein
MADASGRPPDPPVTPNCLSGELKTDLASHYVSSGWPQIYSLPLPANRNGRLCHEAADIADRGWMRKFVQEPSDHKDVAAPDDLSVVLGFTQMLSGGGHVDEVSRLATDRGWLNASGQLTAAGDQLARALLQQSGTRTIFRVW